MSEIPDDADDNESGLGPARRRQLRINAEIQSAEAQKVAARAAVKNARYLLWAVILATFSTVVTTAGTVFVILFNFLHPH
jgi:hypothetical protein